MPMKFIYVDESGSKDQSDVFVMAGLLVDAYRLRKYTDVFNKLISDFLAKHPGTGSAKELKTSALINGTGGWRKIDSEQRKALLKHMCVLSSECASVFAVGLSFSKFEAALAGGHGYPLGTSYWMGAAMYVAALVQDKMQLLKKNKGLTVFICDDNKHEMANFAGALHDANPWFDALYRFDAGKGAQRFNRLVNSAFAIKSQHSSLIQVADAVSYVYRRHLELKTEKESWAGERDYIAGLAGLLESTRELMGKVKKEPCVKFYEAARHAEWAL